MIVVFNFGQQIDHQLTTGSDFCCRRSVFIVDALFYIGFDRCGRAVQNQQKIAVYHRIACRVVVLRCKVGMKPPRRTKSSTLWGAALFVLHGFYGAVKERIRTARAPRFASRGAETPRWGVSRARLGESLRAHLKTSLQCLFAMRFLLLVWILFLE